MNSLPKLAEESILTKQQAEQNLSTFLDQNIPENSTDFLQLLRSYPTLENLGNCITSFLNTIINETFTISHHKLIDRSLCAIITEYKEISRNTVEDSVITSNIELEEVKDKLNDSLIQIQTYKNNLLQKDEIIEQLNNDNSELEKNIVLLKAKILKKKEKIDDLKLKNRQINLNFEEKKISIINQSLTSKISTLDEDVTNEKLFDEICSLTNTIKFNDFEYQKLLQSKHYCLNICQRLLDLCEEYESRISMVEEDKSALKYQLSRLTDENFSLQKSIKESIQNEDYFLSEIDCLKSQISNEPTKQNETNNSCNNFINQDQKLRNEIENLNDTIRTQKNFIVTLSTYINRLIVDGDSFIPLLYQTNRVIDDNSLRKIIIDSVESIKTELFINDYIKDDSQKDIKPNDNEQINLRNQFFNQVFGSREILEQSVDKFIKENSDDYREFSIIIALCAANLNLGSKFTDVRSHLSKIHSQLPNEYQKEDLFSSFQNYLTDSNEIFNKINQINSTSSFFNFKSNEIKTTILDFLSEISKFITSLQENVYPVIRYNRNSLTDLPITISNSVNNFQTQIKDLKIELDDYKEKYHQEYNLHNSQQRYSDEINNKLKEKDKQIDQYINCIKNKDKEFQDFRSNSESLIKEKDLTIKNYENEISKIRKENETNSLLLKNTKKLYKSQIDNVIKIEREKKDKEIKEIKQINSENEKNYIQKLESKRKKVKLLQSQIKDITKLYEKKLKKKTETAESLFNETNEQISLIEESFKQKEEQYQNEIEMLKGKLLEEVQLNSTVKFIEVPTPVGTSFDSTSNNNIDVFIKQIVKILSDFPNNKLNLKMVGPYSTEIAQSKILKALQQLSIDIKEGSENLKNNENLDSSNATIINFPTNNSLSSMKSPIVAKRVVNTRDLRIWENWAVEMAVSMNIPTDSFPEIRTAIHDVVLSQRSKSFMLRNVQSLRIQKKLLIENDLFNLKFSMRQNISLKGIIYFFISASCISKNCKSKLSRSQII